MDLASSLAEREGSNLSVVETWTFEGEDLLRSDRSGLSIEEAEALLDETEADRRRGLDTLLSSYGMTADDHRVHLLKGELAPTVRSLCAQLGVDLIVMGTLDRWGVPGVFIASAAEDLLQMTPVSVLAIKPYGFVSPVAAAGD
jgi:nucleotide-binding universal stress UspA family protein